MKASGRAFKFGKNMDTDSIFPGKYLVEFDPAKLAQHAMEGADITFAAKVKSGDVIVAGPNFGCGSAREQAATALKYAGIGAIVADSFARAFFRNAVNNALPVVSVPGISAQVDEGDLLEIDVEAGVVVDVTKNLTWKTNPASPFVLQILEAGGAIPYYKRKISGLSATPAESQKE